MSKDSELEKLFQKIEIRYAEIKDIPSRQNSFLQHLRSLGCWENEPNDEYPTDATAEFPGTLPIAFAVCHRDCGAREFIVDGSTQECQHCGRNMFRTEVKEYKLK